MKHSSLQNSTTMQYHILETNDSYVVHVVQNNYVPTRKVSLFISWPTIFFLLAIILIIFSLCFTNKAFSDDQEKKLFSSQTLLTVPQSNVYRSRWKESGFLFPDSDSRYLDENDILALSQIEVCTESELIRYAINEIYARHCYLFTSEKYLSFFTNYDWYNGYLNAEDAVLSFNSIEHKNISFLLKAEEKYRYSES